MLNYVILMYPSYNRVYFQSSKGLALSELQAAGRKLSQACLDIHHKEIGGVDYIAFSTQEPLNESDIQILSRLSFVYALYRLEGQDCPVLHPVRLDHGAVFEDDLVTILKYSGKTNETFTKLLVNIGWLLCDSCTDERIHLLDPVCGRGTTLFQGMIYGFDVSGIELDKVNAEQAVIFLTKYLKTKRYKHKMTKTKMSENGKKLCEITRFETAGTKEDYKAGNALQVNFYRGDTLHTDKFIKKNSVDIIAGDLPYGVQHGSSTRTGSFTRNPETLLQEALPHWHKVLKTGGSIVLSWNTFVLKRDQIADLLKTSGFEVQTGEPWDSGFVHRVDQAIIRDIIAARKI